MRLLSVVVSLSNEFIAITLPASIHFNLTDVTAIMNPTGASHFSLSLPSGLPKSVLPLGNYRRRDVTQFKALTMSQLARADSLVERAQALRVFRLNEGCYGYSTSLSRIYGAWCNARLLARGLTKALRER